MIPALGRFAIRSVGELGDLTLFTGRSLQSVASSRRLGRRFIRALAEQGVRCVPVIAIVGIFTGLVLGLQGYSVLNRFGSEGLLGSMVALTLVRELAPVLGSLMLVAQAGSALAAELGLQRQSEQIEALEAMGIEPRTFLVAPRLLASLVSFPLQVAVFATLGVYGGYLSGAVILGVDAGVYWSSARRAVELSDVAECLVKSWIFGLSTVAICAYNGFHAHRLKDAKGAQAVSLSTTRGVILSAITILAADYLITALFVSRP